MRDLTSPRVIYLKATLFLLVGGLACAILLIDHPSLKVAALLAVAIWAFARAYYFAFYVVEHYLDPDYHYVGIWSFIAHVLRYRPRPVSPPSTRHKTRVVTCSTSGST